MKCPNCGSEISESDNFCPHCSAQIKRLYYPTNPLKQPDPKPEHGKRKFKWWYILLAIIGIGIIQSLTANKPNNANTTNPTVASATTNSAANEANSKANYLSQFTWYNDNFGVIIDSANMEYDFIKIKGRVTPLTSRNYNYVQITIGVYSSTGNKIDSVMSNMDDLSAGTTWQFEADGMESSSENCKYKIESVVGW